MKVFYDSNVVLDVLLSRTEFLQDSMAALKLSEIGKVKGYVSAASMTDIHYIIHRNIKSIVTRNKKDYVNSIIPVYTPDEFLEFMKRT